MAALKKPIRVLMVCLGNICRSPLAHGILQHKTNAQKIFVDSAGTASYHTGNLPDSRSIEVAVQNGIDITNQRARQFSVADFEKFDHIFVMDKSNYQDVIALAPDDTTRKKVALILEVVDNEIDEVPDPYYGGDEGFQKVYDLLDESCTVIAHRLTV